VLVHVLHSSSFAKQRGKRTIGRTRCTPIRTRRKAAAVIGRARHDLSRQDEYCARYYPEHDRLICAEWLCTVALDPWIGMHAH
jgi:hypothetical protein